MQGVRPEALVLSALLVVVGCAAMRSKSTQHQVAKHAATHTPGPQPSFTPVPTVAPETPTAGTPAPLPTHPIGNPEAESARKTGKAIGPVVSHLGLARADGTPVQPISVDKNGVPVYGNFVGSGFILIVEGKPGISNLDTGRRVFAYDPNDINARPDLEIETNRDLGDGSPAVCDRRRPDIGGVPGINPPSFANTKKVAEVLNDLACRFETFIESSGACTMNKQGEFSFIKPESNIQFCMIVARAWNFPQGDTLISVRLRDKEGNPGPVKTMILRRSESVRPTRPPQPTRTPTPSRRRP